MNLRYLAIAAALTLSVSAPLAHAQFPTTITPDYNGGYIVQPPLGNGMNSFPTTIRPDYNGGYIIQPPLGNGMNSFPTTVRPNYNGGWIVQPPLGSR
jgi:hypothetical protein